MYHHVLRHQLAGGQGAFGLGEILGAHDVVEFFDQPRLVHVGNGHGVGLAVFLRDDGPVMRGEHLDLALFDFVSRADAHLLDAGLQLAPLAIDLIRAIGAERLFVHVGRVGSAGGHGD